MFTYLIISHESHFQLQVLPHVRRGTPRVPLPIVHICHTPIFKYF